MSFHQGFNRASCKGIHERSELRRLNRSQPWKPHVQPVDSNFSKDAGSKETTSKLARENDQSYNTKAPATTSFGANDKFNRTYDASKSYLSPSEEEDENSDDWYKVNLVRVYRGAAKFDGLAVRMPSEKGHQYRYYASVVENRAPETLVLPSLSFSYEANGLESSVLPQKTVEQPSMLTFWGENAGTITLNHWLQISSSFHPKEESVFSMAVQRDIEEPDLFARLIHSQHAIEDDEFSRHTYLYEDLIQCWGPPQTVDLVQEIRDLANCLAGCDFWDLSLAKNQVIGEFISGKLSQNVAYRFLHQILLSIETFHRLELLDSDQRSKLLTEIPPKVTWDLLAAKVWLKNVKVYSAPGHIHGLYFINEPEQVSVLKEFIRKAKWPTAADAFWVLDHREERQDIYRDQHFLSWISGIVLPGPSTSWLLMNSLLSLEPELIHILDDLDSKHQNTGFRYRSFTYWYRECIMGKVLAAAKGVTEVAGWICACPPSLDLDTFQLVHIAQNEVQHQMKSKHVKRMLQRTRPLGPLSIDQCCPSEYALPVIGRTRSVHDIRIQALNFVPDPAKRDDTSLFFSAITFAIGCRNFSLSLRYNVSFIAAVHCSSGPHLLYKKYKYESVKITTLADMSIWGHADADEDFVYRSVDGISKYDPKNGLSSSAQGEPHCVLVVEAFGSADAEVMARAWCANLGLSAIIADVGTTCPACSIREAYAACVSVVILTKKSELVVEGETTAAWISPKVGRAK